MERKTIMSVMLGGLTVFFAQQGVNYLNFQREQKRQEAEKLTREYYTPFFSGEIGRMSDVDFITFYDAQSSAGMRAILHEGYNENLFSPIERDLKLLKNYLTETVFELPKMPEGDICKVYAIDRDGNKSQPVSIIYDKGVWRKNEK